MKEQPTPKNPSPTQKPSKKVLLLSIAAAFIVLVASVFILRSYMEQQKTLDELSVAGKDLKVVYDKLLATYGNTVTESYFRNECTESSVEIGRGVVTCGPYGKIALTGTGTDLQRDREMLKRNILVTGSFGDVSRGEIDKNIAGDKIGYSMFLKHNAMISGDCTVSEFLDPKTEVVNYSFYCTRVVPDFLPGYVVNK